MNHWLKLSIEYANQRSYLDDLFRVYPTIPEGIREIDNLLWKNVEEAFYVRDNNVLIKNLLRLNLFPVKDSYVAFLKRDLSAIERNPATVSRLCGRLYEMGLDEIYTRASEPKETNRQIGPFFRRWLREGSLGLPPLKAGKFLESEENAILDAGDKEMMDFSKENFGYTRKKGLDFVGRFNGKYIIGEAKFLTDFGGHQNAQFIDGVEIFKQRRLSAVPIAILDGVLYIEGGSKMYRDITGRNLRNKNIMSSLVLREFLYQV